jgi:hypothetical protein
MGKVFHPHRILQAGAALNDALVWDGTSWVPGLATINGEYLPLANPNGNTVSFGTSNYLDLQADYLDGYLRDTANGRRGGVFATLDGTSSPTGAPAISGAFSLLDAWRNMNTGATTSAVIAFAKDDGTAGIRLYARDTATNKTAYLDFMQDGKIYINGTEFTGGGGSGATTFTALTDTPNTYTANKWLKVKADGLGVEFVDAPTGGGTTVTGSETNGNILVGGVEVQVYNDTVLTLKQKATEQEPLTKSLFLGENAGVGFFGVGKQGYANTVLGYEAGKAMGTTTESRASSNTLAGWRAATALTTGSFNTIFGTVAGSALTTQDRNTFIGYHAGLNATGNSLVALGDRALANCSAANATAIGYMALQNASNALYNTAVGHEAMNQATTGGKSTCIGYFAGRNGVSAEENTYVGYLAGSTGTGSYNTVTGSGAGKGLTGSTNTIMGRTAGTLLVAASANVIIGSNAFSQASSGNNNIIIGERACIANVSGSDNIIIGRNATTTTTTASNELNIGGAIFGTGLNGITKVGIGTPAPSTELDVNGVVTIRKRLDVYGVYNAGTPLDFYAADINPDISAGVNNQKLALLRLRHRGSDGTFTGVLRPLLVSENKAGGSHAVQLYEGGLRLGFTTLANPTYNLEVNGTGQMTRLHLTNSALLTTPINNTLENDGTNLYFTIGGIRKQIAFV